MNQDIMKRAMFAMPLSKQSRNAGIMEGFEDDVEMMEEPMGEEMMPMERNPQNPEILMNTLRGDMRSVDSRYAELANMVGEEAAMDTPPEVLAILQDHFAMMDKPQGIGALPQGMQMPPPTGTMPPKPAMPMPPAAQGMPKAPMPMAQGPMPPPVGMAYGGIVQNFAEGSDEQGVTSEESTLPASLASRYRQQAESGFANLMNQKAEPVPSLASAMESNIPTYQKLLGTGDKDYMKTMMFLDIANRGLAFAANVDPQTGMPLEGSFASRFAGASRGLPETMMKYLGQERKEDQAVKLAALQAAEKSIEGIKERNYKLIETQRKTFAEILKADAKGAASSLFGKAQWAENILTSDLIARYSAGQTTPKEDRFVEMANAKLTQGRTETFKDPVTGQTKTVTIPGLNPPYLPKAMEARAKLDRLNQVSTLPGGAAVVAATAKEAATVPAATTSTAPAPAEPEQTPVQTGLFQQIPSMTGIVPSLRSGAAGLPIVGGGEEGSRLSMQRQGMLAYLKQVKDVFQKAKTYTQFEAIEMDKILPDPTAFLTNPENMQFRFVGLDDTMAEVQRKAQEILSQRGKDVQPAKTLQEAQDILNKVTAYRQRLGVPRPTNLDEVRALPIGSYFWYEPQQKILRRK